MTSEGGAMTVDLKALLKRRVEKTREIFIGRKRVEVIEKKIIRSVPLGKKGQLPPSR